MAYDKKQAVALAVRLARVREARKRGVAMGVIQGPTGFKPAQPKPPTDLEKELAAAPPYPGVYEAVRADLGDRADAFIYQAAVSYFSYALLLGADKGKLEKDPYWKYMEE